MKLHCTLLNVNRAETDADHYFDFTHAHYMYRYMYIDTIAKTIVQIMTFLSSAFPSLGTTYGSSVDVATLISCAAQTKMKEVTMTLRTGLLGMSTRTP